MKIITYKKYLHSFFKKIQKMYMFLYKNIGVIFITIIFMISISVFMSPSLSFNLGNIFFGGVKSLYNVKLAQLLYKRSVNPLFSQETPRYAHHQLSRTYFIQGDLWNALDEAQKELEIYPDDTATYYILGLTYGYMNRTHEAIDSFSKYIETHPNTWAGKNDKAWLQFRIGDIDGALETIEPITEKFKYTVWIQNTYCALLINKKDFINAKKVCDHAKESVNKMTEGDWGQAYPGNDPRIYAIGLQAMKKSVDDNLKIIEEQLSNKSR